MEGILETALIGGAVGGICALVFSVLGRLGGTSSPKTEQKICTACRDRIAINPPLCTRCRAKHADQDA